MRRATCQPAPTGKYKKTMLACMWVSAVCPCHSLALRVGCMSGCARTRSHHLTCIFPMAWYVPAACAIPLFGVLGECLAQCVLPLLRSVHTYTRVSSFFNEFAGYPDSQLCPGSAAQVRRGGGKDYFKLLL